VERNLPMALAQLLGISLASPNTCCEPIQLPECVATKSNYSDLECVCCFVLLNQYWGIVTVPGSFLKAGDLGSW